MTALSDPDRPAPHHRPLSKAARLDRISTAVRRDGFVNVDDLVEALGVSRMTVHRDLDELQALGTLRKVRGGASAQRSTRYESDLEFRLGTAVDEKRRIAAAAAELVNDGDVVIVDDSTSALHLVPHLTQRSPLTVITNALPVLQALGEQNEVSVIALGGLYDVRHAAFLGILCENALATLYADVLFASTSSMRDRVLYHQDPAVVAAKQAMIRAAGRRVLLLDHTKIGHGALYRLCDVGDFTHVVVDDSVDDEVVRTVRETGVEVLVC
ncbi:DeoR/GlpR family DNA-binding transcription regulator [Raineyella sp. LH-20]|uniref:DeoR/GlpR family DNA-binding transcription regulator n=1 Tax=Raineyella sp. LH-20 TaxID=3081204 RepID=UPI0029536085|nr:DeoR/GlpR family DNA-binding transcription regulator [Raineyella sp. LH-20]WOP18560.1 DeoR/GlpR family DNA-binding transcription regulator [Raineyella sp. LH-20]